MVIGSLLTRLYPQPIKPSSIPSIISSLLIIRPGGIGDALLLARSIKALRSWFPATAIDVLAERRNAGAFALLPGLRDTMLYDDPTGLATVLSRRYDVVIDTEQWHRLSAVVCRLVRSEMKIGFATNARARMFTHPVSYNLDRYEVESFLDLLSPLGIRESVPILPTALAISEATQQQVAELLRPLGQKPLLVLFAGASIPEKRWAAKNFRAVIDWSLAEGLTVAMVGGTDDTANNETIAANRPVLNLAGRTSLAGTAAVLERAACVVSGDSGILHLAAGLNQPTIALFGPSSAVKWAPRGERHITIQKADCSPCSHFGTTSPCPRGIRCMSEITVEEVTASISRLISLPTDQG